jgi:hypothetical protein
VRPDNLDAQSVMGLVERLAGYAKAGCELGASHWGSRAR